MEKIESNKSKKAGVGLSLFLAATLGFATLPMITACGDDGKEDKQEDWKAGDFQGIEVWAASNVSNTKAQAIIDIMEDLYINTWDATEIGNFTTRTTEIYIKSGTGTNFTGSILTICCDDNNSTIVTALMNLVAQVEQKNDIMLAKYNNLKKQVLTQMKQIEAERVKA